MQQLCYHVSDLTHSSIVHSLSAQQLTLQSALLILSYSSRLLHKKKKNTFSEVFSWKVLGFLFLFFFSRIDLIPGPLKGSRNNFVYVKNVDDVDGR